MLNSKKNALFSLIWRSVFATFYGKQYQSRHPALSLGEIRGKIISSTMDKEGGFMKDHQLWMELIMTFGNLVWWPT